MTHDEPTHARMADDLTADEGRAIRPELPDNLGHIRVVLVETLQAGNIGSAARAIKGMGITSLWLVNPPSEWRNSSEARKFAMNSQDVLFAARETSSITEAIDDVHFVVGTTHRRRVRRMAQPIDARTAAHQIARISQTHEVAILFGREDFGLPNEDLERCDLIASIPMATKNPSLNIAQAVQIIAYEVFMASVGEVEPIPFQLATHRDKDAALYRIERVLRAVDFRPANREWSAIRVPIERVLSRVPLETRDLEVLMKVCRDIENYVHRNVTRTDSSDA